MKYEFRMGNSSELTIKHLNKKVLNWLINQFNRLKFRKILYTKKKKNKWNKNKRIKIIVK